MPGNSWYTARHGLSYPPDIDRAVVCIMTSAARSAHWRPACLQLDDKLDHKLMSWVMLSVLRFHIVMAGPTDPREAARPAAG